MVVFNPMLSKSLVQKSTVSEYLNSFLPFCLNLNFYLKVTLSRLSIELSRNAIFFVEKVLVF